LTFVVLVRKGTGFMKPRHILLAVLAALGTSTDPTCGDITTPAFAETDRAPTVNEVIRVMASIPEERCLYNPNGKHCDQPAGHEKGPDARRIAQAIVANADGSLLGSKIDDAALMAVFSSYESGNKADAVGDGGKAIGAWQIHYFGDVAFDPDQAAPIWRSIAKASLKVCSANEPDERLASVAGSCSYPAAKRKVRQRVQLARKLADDVTAAAPQ
jgi:hypothetical protein